ncbi:hypothetical protein BT63DRAFT_478871 [Microthyrium microscopicum]|uniref:Uncharacterized protein n=1 Tax=Microthyrium microscopicum TaxID=703497 RepID=A0A6A6UBZ1_9PEZI|nr:hypothetical protein BT63DRAFT_478871 [Microthyrium microscopicum]
MSNAAQIHNGAIPLYQLPTEVLDMILKLAYEEEIPTRDAYHLCKTCPSVWYPGATAGTQVSRRFRDLSRRLLFRVIKLLYYPDGRVGEDMGDQLFAHRLNSVDYPDSPLQLCRILILEFGYEGVDTPPETPVMDVIDKISPLATYFGNVMCLTVVWFNETDASFWFLWSIIRTMVHLRHFSAFKSNGKKITHSRLKELTSYPWRLDYFCSDSCLAGMAPIAPPGYTPNALYTVLTPVTVPMTMEAIEELLSTQKRSLRTLEIALLTQPIPVLAEGEEPTPPQLIFDKIHKLTLRLIPKQMLPATYAYDVLDPERVVLQLIGPESLDVTIDLSEFGIADPDQDTEDFIAGFLQALITHEKPTKIVKIFYAPDVSLVNVPNTRIYATLTFDPLTHRYPWYRFQEIAIRFHDQGVQLLFTPNIGLGWFTFMMGRILESQTVQRNP